VSLLTISKLHVLTQLQWQQQKHQLENNWNNNSWLNWGRNSKNNNYVKLLVTIQVAGLISQCTIIHMKIINNINSAVDSKVAKCAKQYSFMAYFMASWPLFKRDQPIKNETQNLFPSTKTNSHNIMHYYVGFGIESSLKSTNLAKHQQQ